MRAAPKRRTRQEAQQQTRARLVDAALNLVAEAGVGAASIRGICERAGFSQGAFYSNFSGKDELLLALVSTHMTRIARTLVDLVETTDGLDLDDSLHRLGRRLDELSRNPVLSLLIIELNLHAQRDTDFAARFASATDAYQSEFTRLMETLITRHGLSPRQPAGQIAATMLAIWFGTIVQTRAADRPAASELQMAYFRAVIAAA